MAQDQKSVGPVGDIPYAQARRLYAIEALAENDIIEVVAEAGAGILRGARKAEILSTGELLICTGNPGAGDEFRAVPYKVRANINTVAYTAGDILYAGAAGALATSGARPVAVVAVSSATVGVLEYCPTTLEARGAGLREYWSPTFGRLWAIDNDGAHTNGGGLVCGGASDVTLTEAAAAYCQVDDGGVFTTLAAATYALFPAVPADDDAAYFGKSTPFAEIAFDMSATVAVHTGDSASWEYWDGTAWVALTIVQDNTNAATKTGARPFTRDGAIHFLPPSDWAATTVNSQSAFWVRCVLATAANMTTSPATNSVEHKIVTVTDAFVCPKSGTIFKIRGVSSAQTLPSTVAPKFVLYNQTTGLVSEELTWALNKQYDSWTLATPFVVTVGDSIAVLVTVEDGTAEHQNVALELTVGLL